MKVKLGDREVEMGGQYLKELRSSNDIFEDTDELRKRMEEDGYLLFRQFHDREQVVSARQNVMNRLQEMGRLDPNYSIDHALIGKDNKSVFFDNKVDYPKELPDFYNTVTSPTVMGFFDRFLGGPSLTYDFKWLRAVPNGPGAEVHYDIVFMGRGSHNLYTMWTPLVDVTLDGSPLCICVGSHKFKKLIDTYGQLDVVRDRVAGGALTKDPFEIIEKFGGQWATTAFETGDVIIFGMYTLHMSLGNYTNKYRISCDTRFQLASDPVDSRYIGKNTTPPSFDSVERNISIEEMRKKWGI